MSSVLWLKLHYNINYIALDRTTYIRQNVMLNTVLLDNDVYAIMSPVLAICVLS